MIKTIRLKAIKGGGSKALFVASNITIVKPNKDNTSEVCVTGDTKGIEVYESADEIEQMIKMETLGVEASSNFLPVYPKIEHE